MLLQFMRALPKRPRDLFDHWFYFEIFTVAQPHEHWFGAFPSVGALTCAICKIINTKRHVQAWALCLEASPAAVHKYLRDPI